MERGNLLQRVPQHERVPPRKPAREPARRGHDAAVYAEVERDNARGRHREQPEQRRVAAVDADLAHRARRRAQHGGQHARERHDGLRGRALRHSAAHAQQVLLQGVHLRPVPQLDNGGEEGARDRLGVRAQVLCLHTSRGGGGGAQSEAA